jgi:hypothetical protein
MIGKLTVRSTREKPGGWSEAETHPKHMPPVLSIADAMVVVVSLDFDYLADALVLEISQSSLDISLLLDGMAFLQELFRT